MRRKQCKSNYRRTVLRLPDLDYSKLAVLNSLTSPASRRVYEYAIDHVSLQIICERELAICEWQCIHYDWNALGHAPSHGRIACLLRSGSFQELQFAGALDASLLSTMPVWTPLSRGNWESADFNAFPSMRS
jgi:hypothetical protein